ncbi:MAG: TIGR01777 family oxidoreductase [Xanthomonadaceae bacterium]|nr:TIGR01777 family oxidoreductase [Xanthomonadaceae bacterium]
MNILMTGATGLIGKKLGIELVRNGHKIKALVRNIEHAKLELPFPAELILWDSSKTLDPQTFDSIDSVINLAGEPVSGARWSKKRKQAIYDSRIVGTKNLVSSLISSGKKIKSFISTSAIGYYGDSGDQPLRETASAGQGFLSQVCFDWENSVKPLRDVTRSCVIRIGVVLTPDGGALGELIPLYKNGFGGVIGSGNQWMSWIHVDDLLSVFVEAVGNESYLGAINAVSPQAARNRDFSHTLAKSMGVRDWLPIPKQALQLRLGEQSQIVLESLNVFPEALRKLKFNFNYPKLDLALNHLIAPLKHPKTGKIVNTLTTYQWVPKPLPEVFEFFSLAKNLETLTPDFLNFKITKESSGPMKAGKLIEYDLKLHGIPIHWETEIAEWVDGKSFVDNQLKGPYKLWYHLHEFSSLGNGTLMKDHVRFQLPIHFISDAIAGWKVKDDVNKIFDYRMKTVNKLFG